MDFNLVKWPAALQALRKDLLAKATRSDASTAWHTVPKRHDRLIFSVATREFLPILDVWIRHAQALRGTDVAILAADPETAGYCDSRGMAHVLHHLPEAAETTDYLSATGFSARGLLATALKFPAVQSALTRYDTVVLCDLDALVLRDPFPHLHPDADIAFQRDFHYPLPMVQDWGLAACSGFVCFRRSAPVAAFIESALRWNEVYYSDQVALNFALKDQAPTWRRPNIVGIVPDLPVDSQDVFGATAPMDILGQSRDRALKFHALPADTFYRHRWIYTAPHRLVLYHPNMVKDIRLKARLLADYSKQYAADRKQRRVTDFLRSLRKRRWGTF